MEELFADTSYWVALLRRTDFLRQRAIALANELLTHARIVNSDLVIVETLNGASKEGPRARLEACELFSSLRQDPANIILRASDELFERAENHYKRSADKSWSLTDCSSFVIMRDRRIHNALTYDHHFIQAGFRALLREEE